MLEYLTILATQPYVSLTSLPMSHDFRDFKCFKDLVNGPRWIRQAWGDACSIAWDGTDSQIQLAHNLVSNYDLRPNDPKWGNAPLAPELRWQSMHIASIYMTDQRIFDTLRFYFEVQLLNDRETGHVNPDAVIPRASSMSVDETEVAIPGESDIEYATRVLAEREEMTAQLAALEVEADELPESWVSDPKRCAILAAQMATAFISEHITTKCFMPSPVQPLLAEHTLGRGDHDEHAEFESLVDRAIS